MKICASMSLKDAIIAMAEGNPGAASAMIDMLSANETKGTFGLLYLDTLGIYGEKLYMLWNDCCGRDSTKVFDTLDYFRSGKISEEDIFENLNRPRAKPFI